MGEQNVNFLGTKGFRIKDIEFQKLFFFFLILCLPEKEA